MITLQQLKELLEFDPETGLFTRKKKTNNKFPVGSQAGSKDAKGYTVISISGKIYKAHRLVWLYTHGVWPSGEIDHINHIPSDNRISNLRDVTKSENQHNRKSSNGFSKDRNRWKAAIRIRGTFRHLGCFATQEEAAAAYQKARAAK